MKIFPDNFTIAAIAPAGAVGKEVISSGCDMLRSLGAKVKSMPHAAGRDAKLPYLSGSDDERVADLLAAWLDPEISMIWAIRGGYGCGKFLEKLDWSLLAQHPKAVAGFSDITALHWAMCAKNCGTYMALPMFSFLAQMDEFTRQSLQAIFAGKEQHFQLPALRPGKVCALPLPGNLTVAASLCGTPFFPDCSGKILFLEDVGEHPYRLDRTLNQLRLAGAFDHCAAVVFGYFTSSGDAKDIMPVLEDFTARISSPVFYGFNYGHELPFTALSGAVPVSITPLTA